MYLGGNGLFRFYGQVGNVDANTLEQGAYYLTNNCTNVPVEYCYLLCITASNNVINDMGQLAFSVNNIWFRRKSGSWSEWKAVF